MLQTDIRALNFVRHQNGQIYCIHPTLNDTTKALRKVALWDQEGQVVRMPLKELDATWWEPGMDVFSLPDEHTLLHHFPFEIQGIDEQSGLIVCEQNGLTFKLPSTVLAPWSWTEPLSPVLLAIRMCMKVIDSLMLANIDYNQAKTVTKVQVCEIKHVPGEKGDYFNKGLWKLLIPGGRVSDKVFVTKIILTFEDNNKQTLKLGFWDVDNPFLFNRTIEYFEASIVSFLQTH